MVARREFRSDLYYRLNVFPIRIPPLRERREDIPLLVRYFAQRFAKDLRRPIESVSRESMEMLCRWPWPGNIRELQNVIERSVILNAGEVFAVDPSWLSKQPARRQPAGASPVPSQGESRSERQMIEAALAACRGRVGGPSGAAMMLGVPPSTLDHRIRALRINKTQFKFR
jgi:formate hydrogenlyase transcriptional activator